MKSIICVLIAITTIIIPAHAQDFKPTKGDLGAEVNLSPFSSSPVDIDQIKLRGFIDDNKAFRVGVMFSFQYDDNLNNTVYTDGVNATYKTYEFEIAPGYERHFDASERLSPYLGFELAFSYKVSEATMDQRNGQTYKTEGAWDLEGTERGYTKLGINAIIGADYYIAKSLYLGVEFGYGYELLDQRKITTNREGFTAEQIDGGESFNLGKGINNAIRLGFNF
jgi:hypothetical protein